MDKKIAKIILDTKDENLIALWKSLEFDEYNELRRTMSDALLISIVKKIAMDIIEDRPTLFEMVDEKGNMYCRFEYLGE
jgi:hypothetical protein